MDLDLASSWTLSFFGACFAGMLVGFVVAKLLGFDLGLAVGLLIPGILSLGFTWRFATEYVDFRDNPSQAIGRVVAIEDRPANESGSVTTPFAIVEFSARDGASHRTASKGGSGLHEGDEVTVVYDANDPARTKVGRTDEMLGGAVASMLFGTFPTSAGLFYLLGWLSDRWPRKQSRSEAERASQPSRLTPLGNLLLFGGILGGGFWPGDVLEQIGVGFGVVSLGLWVHVVDGVRLGRDPRWTLGMAVLAINFSAWVVALWLLREPATSW